MRGDRSLGVGETLRLQPQEASDNTVTPRDVDDDSAVIAEASARLFLRLSSLIPIDRLWTSSSSSDPTEGCGTRRWTRRPREVDRAGGGGDSGYGGGS